jgi:hypothetical protein
VKDGRESKIQKPLDQSERINESSPSEISNSENDSNLDGE